MIRRFWFILILVLAGMHSNVLTSADRMDFGFLLRVIRKTEAGKKLLENTSDQELKSLLVWGDVSHTDAVIGRTLASDSHKEVHTRHVTVFVKKNAGWMTQAVELAHELVHAIHPPEWSPYDEDLSLTKYIRSQIESKGGEYEALRLECKIKDELMALYPDFSVDHAELEKRCQPLREEDVKVFYRVGKSFQKLKQLGAEIDSLSTESPLILSAMGGEAYPVAMAEEYLALNQVACRNTQRRLQNGFADAQTESFLKKRCEF